MHKVNALFFYQIHYTNIVSSKQLHFLSVKRGFPLVSFVSPYLDLLLLATSSTGKITDASSFKQCMHNLRSTICMLVLCVRVRIHVCVELINTEVLSTFCFPTTSSSNSLLKMFVLFFCICFVLFFTYKLTDKNHQPVRCSCLIIMYFPNKYIFMFFLNK